MKFLYPQGVSSSRQEKPVKHGLMLVRVYRHAEPRTFQTVVTQRHARMRPVLDRHVRLVRTAGHQVHLLGIQRSGWL